MQIMEKIKKVLNAKIIALIVISGILLSEAR